MADKTWAGGTSDDAAVAGNWSPSGVPASNDKVEIPDASTTSNDCRLTTATSWGTLTIATDGILVGNGQTLTLNGGVNDGGTAADYNYTDAGQTSNVSGSLDIVMRNLRSSGDRAIITAAANNIRNLKIDDFTADGGGTGKVYTVQSHITISGDLTVEYGELNTAFSSTSYNLTVTGTTTIGPNSGAEDQATLTCNASTISLGSGITSSAYGLYVNQGGTFTGGSGTHTLGSVVVRNNAAAKCTLTSVVTTIDGEHGGENYAINIEGSNSVFAHGSGTVTITRASDTRIRNSGAALALNNLIINHASAVITLASNGLTCAGDFTITAGEFGTGADKALTVGGGIKNTGTLTANASTIIITGEIAGFAFDQMGTFNAGTSTIQIGDGSTSTVGSSTHFKSNNCHNLIINQHIDAPNGNVAWRAYSGTEVTIGGNLTITRGRFYRNTSTQDLTVTGDVDIASVGQVGTSSASGSNTFGGIKIASGGTYLATSGTTTVTNRFTGTSNLWKNDGGTFTHNNGTVKFTDNDHSLVKELTFYNLEQASSLGDYALSWETQSGTACTILGNLTITRGDFEIHAAGNTLDIHGQTILNGSSDTGARFNNDKNQTATITHHGIVTINGGTYHVEDGATVNMAGIRNLGGVVD